MKAVAAHSLRIELLGDGVVVRKSAMATMERRVEAGDLRQVRTSSEKQSDRRQIVRLVQRRQRDVALQARQNISVNHGRLAVFRAAMNDAMADGSEANRLRLPQPGLHLVECGGKVRHVIWRKRLVNA